MVKAAKTLKSHLPNILTYFKHRIAECRGRGAQSQNSNGRTEYSLPVDFRNREHFKTAIYFHCGGLDLYPCPKPYSL